MLPIVLALAIIAIVLVTVIAGQPSDLVICRSTKISAPPEKLFPHVNDLHKWNEWSPWAKRDPNAKHTFDGASAGTGASMSWDGNKDIGAGRMTIVESRPSDLVRYKLEFIRPFANTNIAEFRFLPDGGQTEVKWTMSGKTNFVFKVFGLLVNCDDMVGRDFEKGLATLKAIVESNAPINASREFRVSLHEHS